MTVQFIPTLICIIIGMLAYKTTMDMCDRGEE